MTPPTPTACRDYLSWREADPPLATDECRWYEWRDGSCELTEKECRWMGRPGRNTNENT